MRVLVTGNLGYIGSVLTPMLMERGHEAYGFDTGFFDECLLSSAPENSVVVQHRADIREIQEEQLDGMEAIVHLSALSNDPMGELDPGLTHRINTLASERLAMMAKRAGCSRFVFASSCSIYGQSDDHSLTEESTFNPLTAYARSKVETEAILRKFADEDFSPTFMRNATAYGFSPRIRLDIAVNNLAAWGFTTGEVKLLSDGRSWRPMVHVRDICLAVCEALDAPRETVHNEALNVGVETENYQIRAIAEMVAEALPGTRVTFAEGAAADARSYNVSFEKIRRVLPKFETRWTVRSGIEEIVSAFREQGLRDDQFHGRLYTRLRQLQYLLAERLVDSDLRWKTVV